MSGPIGTSEWDGTVQAGDRLLISASTAASKTLAAEALERWRQKRSAAWILDNLESLPTFAAALGRDDMIKLLADSWKNTPDGVLPQYAVGNHSHQYLEDRINGTQTLHVEPQHLDQCRPFFHQIEDFLARFRMEAVAAEQVVFSPEDGVAGRFDFKFRIDHPSLPGVSLVDMKTAEEPKRIYGDSHGLQLTAYRYATHQATFDARVITGRNGVRHYLASDAELAACTAPVPVDHTLILQVTPVSNRLVPIRTGDTSRAYLRSVVNANRWKSGVGDSLVEPDIDPVGVPA